MVLTSWWREVNFEGSPHRIVYVGQDLDMLQVVHFLGSSDTSGALELDEDSLAAQEGGVSPANDILMGHLHRAKLAPLRLLLNPL